MRSHKFAEATLMVLKADDIESEWVEGRKPCGMKLTVADKPSAQTTDHRPEMVVLNNHIMQLGM